MKIPVGVVGLGNLGKSIKEKLVGSDEFELVGCFSKRKIDGAIPFEEIEKYKEKIDLMFLCGGSQNELEKQALSLVESFSIVECYDNHSRLKTYLTELDKKAKENKKIALCSLGWDPGLFSLIRAMFAGIGLECFTTWGKGLSQGHTQAIKTIGGVVDAVQFTIPNKREIAKRKEGKESTENLHKRLCYVVAKRGKEREIEEKIVNMPDYFVGYKTKVKFVSQREIEKKKDFSHKGQVFVKNDVANFSLKLASNPDFTAQVATSFARAYSVLKKDEKYGAFTILDIPMTAILKKEKYLYL